MYQESSKKMYCFRTYLGLPSPNYLLTSRIKQSVSVSLSLSRESPEWKVGAATLKASPSERVCSLARPRQPAVGWQPDRPLLTTVSPHSSVYFFVHTLLWLFTSIYHDRPHSGSTQYCCAVSMSNHININYCLTRSGKKNSN